MSRSTSRTDQLVIFGASGDLTSRKLVPALTRNHRDGAFTTPIQVVGVSRSEKTSEQWREELAAALPEHLRGPFESFAPSFHWVASDAARPENMATLKAQLDALIERTGSTSSEAGRLFYLALAPKLFGPVVASLSQQGMLQCAPHSPDAWRRVVIEKPFGTDLATARALNQQLLTHLRAHKLSTL